MTMQNESMIFLCQVARKFIYRCKFPDTLWQSRPAVHCLLFPRLRLHLTCRTKAWKECQHFERSIVLVQHTYYTHIHIYFQYLFDVYICVCVYVHACKLGSCVHHLHRDTIRLHEGVEHCSCNWRTYLVKSVQTQDPSEAEHGVCIHATKRVCVTF